ncbi:MAG: universal stress protein [Bacteroidota bacterium]
MTKKNNSKKPARGKKAARSRRKTLTVELNRILVPIDFSDHSRKALQYAVPFAKKFNASIDLIYVVEPTVYPADFSFGQVGFPAIEDELRKRGADELDELLQKDIAKQVPAKRAVRTGKAFYEILLYAKEERIDFIIIATHGHSGIEHALFGSTAEKVVRKASCPVLVVRTGER